VQQSIHIEKTDNDDQDIEHLTSHCFPIPGGSFNNLAVDFGAYSEMDCKITTW